MNYSEIAGGGLVLGGGAATGAAVGGRLPVTGIAVGGIVALALVLVVIGLVLVRTASQHRKNTPA